MQHTCHEGCTHPRLLLSGENDEESLTRKQLRMAFEQMMQTLFKQKGAKLDISVMASPKVQEFINTHAGVLNEGMKQVQVSDAMRKRLQRSNYVFSGMKAFHELNEAFPALLDENGNRKPFNQFLTEVRKIDNTYNRNYLESEYNFVAASAEMAEKWERFTADGDRYNLQYRTAKDDKVRPEHEEMEGITLPINSPFWEDFYPPNGWNCRCTVVQVRKSKYSTTPLDEAKRRAEDALQKMDGKGKMFRFNAGMEGRTVPAHNPYTISKCNSCPLAKSDNKNINLAKVSIPQNEMCKACKIVQASNKKADWKAFNDERNRLRRSNELPTSSESIEFNNLMHKLSRNGKSLKNFLAHCRSIEELDVVKEVWNNPQKLIFERISQLGEGKDLTDDKAVKNLEKKKERGVVSYFTYRFEYMGKIWEIKTELIRDKYEQFYSIAPMRFK